MIQHRIANKIKTLETINESLNYYNQRKYQEEENLQNLINSFIQESQNEEDGESIDSLVKYLYWYTNMAVKQIGTYTDLSHQLVVKKAGYLVHSASCIRCQSIFPSKRNSRSDIGSKICPSCEAQNIIDQHKVFLEDWIDSEWVNHQNPQMDRKTYTAYLHSKHWKKVRSVALQKAGYKCQACSTKDTILDVHHNSYDRLGNEDPSDLIVLCRSCHAKVHEK